MNAWCKELERPGGEELRLQEAREEEGEEGEEEGGEGPSLAAARSIIPGSGGRAILSGPRWRSVKSEEFLYVICKQEGRMV